MSLLGSVGSFLKKTVKGAAIGFVTGGIPGAIAGGVAANVPTGGDLYRPQIPTTQAPVLYGSTAGFFPTSMGASSLPTVFDPRVSGSVGDYMTPDFMIAPRAAGGMRSPCQYTLRSGQVKNGHIGARGNCVPNRRMNPLNPRAARRAIRRVRGVRRIAQNIERALPKARTRRRAA
jgi:hypothetical protein